MKGTRLNLRWAVVCEGVTVAQFAWCWQAELYVKAERLQIYDQVHNAFPRALSIRDRVKERTAAARRRRTS